MTHSSYISTRWMAREDRERHADRPLAPDLIDGLYRLRAEQVRTAGDGVCLALPLWEKTVRSAMTISNPPDRNILSGTLESGFNYQLTDVNVAIRDNDGNRVYEADYADVKSVRRVGRRVTIEHYERGKVDLITNTPYDALEIERLIRSRLDSKRAFWQIHGGALVAGGAVGFCCCIAGFAFLWMTGELGDPCKSVSDAKLHEIEERLDAGLHLRNGQAIDAYRTSIKGGDELWFIAADIEGPGFEGDDDIGVWTSWSLERPSPRIRAANALAREHSTWPTTGDGREDSILEAERCLG